MPLCPPLSPFFCPCYHYFSSCRSLSGRLILGAIHTHTDTHTHTHSSLSRSQFPSSCLVCAFDSSNYNFPNSPHSLCITVVIMGITRFILSPIPNDQQQPPTAVSYNMYAYYCILYTILVAILCCPLPSLFLLPPFPHSPIPPSPPYPLPPFLPGLSCSPKFPPFSVLILRVRTFRLLIKQSHMAPC